MTLAKSKSQALKKALPQVDKVTKPAKPAASKSKKPPRKKLVQQDLPFWSELLETTVGVPETNTATTNNTDNAPSPEPEPTMSAATLSTKKSITELAINTIRTLSMDAVQAANSGHPGTPMALAPVAYTIWQTLLRYDPADPHLAGPRSLRAVAAATRRCCSTRCCTWPE